MTWAPRTDLVTVRDLVLDAAGKWPDRLFIDVSGEALSYADTGRLMLREAACLHELGVRFGERVASLYDNNVDNLAVWFGTSCLGAIECSINSAHKGEFLRHQLAKSGARVAFTEADYLPRFAAIADQLTDLQILVVRGAVDQDFRIDGLTVLPLEEFRANAAAEPPSDLRVPSLDDICTIIWTGGTTGPSKGCSISHGYLMHQTARINFGYGRREPHVIWTPNPLFHAFAKSFPTIGTMMFGGSCYLEQKFSVSKFWPQLNRSGADWAALLGSMTSLIAAAPETEEEKQNTTLKTVLSLPFPPGVQERFRKRWGVRCVTPPNYGFTESVPLTNKAPEVTAPPGSSGKVDSDYWELRIVDDNDADVPTGVAGEVVARPKAPHVMFSGYWDEPEGTLRIMRNLWLHTGDIGYFDAQGWFYFQDRKKDYLRRRGENISSHEVEAVFAMHPDIQDVCVHAVPSDLTEDDLKLTALLVPGSMLTEEELARWSVDKLPYYAVPRYIEFRDTLPLSDLAKPLKYQLREEGVTRTTWDIEKSDVTFERR